MTYLHGGLLVPDGFSDTFTFPLNARAFLDPFQSIEVGISSTSNRALQEVVRLTDGITLTTLPPRAQTGPSRGIDWNSEILLTLQPGQSEMLYLYDLRTGVRLTELRQNGVREAKFSENNLILAAWPTERNEIVFWGVQE
jgi:hypothetical protein